MGEISLLVLHVLFVLALGYYFMTSMQWYSYKIERVLFHYNRYDWHVYYFLLPLVAYYMSFDFIVYWVYALYFIALFLWYKKRDKKLVFTSRVKRFFLFLFLITLFQNILCSMYLTCNTYGIIIPLFFAQFFSFIFEKMLFLSFKKEAKAKISQMEQLKVIAITASYGKTSIKNFLAQILSSKFSVYATPRSVNTLGGIIKDINEDLPNNTQVYIVEAGARAKGDIDEIATLVQPHIAVVGKIGEQHIEYFKTLENIRNTKMEMIHSSRLEKAFVHESAQVRENDKIKIFGEDLSHIESTLDGISFDMELNGSFEHFTCKLLGDFNAINIAAAIHVALSLGMDMEAIKRAVLNLKGVDHRLQRMEAGGKIIIDDSFNGNFDGMMSSYALASTYDGRKVIITPGIVESSESANIALAQKIDDVFDLVIITGKVNLKVLDLHVRKAEKIILEDKSKMQEILAQYTRAGDLILFSNDAPNFL